MHKNLPKIGIIVGSTRPGRNAFAVAQWVADIAAERDDAIFELIDIADYNLPLLDEQLSALASARMELDYANAHTKTWSEAISRLDGYVMITPEYNFGMPAALKNALDFLHPEWNDKAAGFVSYGSNGGVRSTAQLRVILSELKIASVVPEVNLSLYTNFENYPVFKPAEVHIQQVNGMLKQLVAWSSALMQVRGTHHV
ncbi:NAD(P)H-dependent FMN reductase [Maritalea myrionectae]|uniref:NAD(P)H-dependent FMN reductase n=1 Tax=Maritalea myrionectae TaxID=454601 RepID=A0A2R4MGH8_9HYPH|nr:NAD(P)H-dependent oxidoreductase [Maritalea myrionectae]AVX04989.1 NAD(P)H-dependent FMN reductase [Maritalea myrionectae]